MSYYEKYLKYKVKFIRLKEFLQEAGRHEIVVVNGTHITFGNIRVGISVRQLKKIIIDKFPTINKNKINIESIAFTGKNTFTIILDVTNLPTNIDSKVLEEIKKHLGDKKNLVPEEMMYINKHIYKERELKSQLELHYYPVSDSKNQSFIMFLTYIYNYNYSLVLSGHKECKDGINMYKFNVDNSGNNSVIIEDKIKYANMMIEDLYDMVALQGAVTTEKINSVINELFNSIPNNKYQEILKFGSRISSELLLAVINKGKGKKDNHDHHTIATNIMNELKIKDSIIYNFVLTELNKHSRSSWGSNSLQAKIFRYFFNITLETYKKDNIKLNN